MRSDQKRCTVLVEQTTDTSIDPTEILSPHKHIHIEPVPTKSPPTWRETTETADPECVVLTAQQTEGQWTSIVQMIHSTAPALPVVLVAPTGTEQLARRAIQIGIDKYVNLAAEPSESLIDRVEAAVEQYRQQYETQQYYGETLAHHAGDPIFLINGSHDLLQCNQAMCGLVDCNKQEIVGRHLGEFISNEDLVALRRTITDIRQDSNRRTGTVNARISTESDTVQSCELSVTPVLDETDNHQQTVVVARDRTEYKQQKEQLKKQNDRLENFASLVAHDIRNPLSVAVGRLEVLDGAYNNQHIERIDAAHQRIEQIIDDLLAVARTGSSDETVQKVSLQQLVTDAWDTVDTDDATLKIEANHRVKAEPGRLRQLFENLFRNAIEHTYDSPTVRVGTIEPLQTSTRSTDDIDPQGFYVEDNGPGISVEDRDEVFDYGQTGTKDGTGYGLAIIQDIVTEHSWNIHVTESATGGACFEISGVTMQSN